MLAMANYPVEVRESPLHGLGVFATRDIEAEERIELCPVIVFTAEDANLGTTLNHYTFGHIVEGQSFLALGYGSLYNESRDNPNTQHCYTHQNRFIEFYARRDIKAGEELLINYNRGSQGVITSEDKADLMKDWVPHKPERVYHSG